MYRYRYAFCEVFARKLLPAIKLYIASKLVREHGFTQLEASKLLGVKQPLINYVLSGRRKPKYMDLIVSIPSIKKGIDGIVEEIAVKRSTMFNGGNIACTICSLIRSSGRLMDILDYLGYRSDEVQIPPY